MATPHFESDPDYDSELSFGERGPGIEIKACKAHCAVRLMNKLTALLVDDDRACQTVIKAQLHYFGVETQVVSTGQAAIDLLAAGARFDLIIINKYLRPRDMKGLKTARRIRTMGIRCKMVGMLFEDSEVARQAFQDAGVDKYTEKPLRFNWLAGLLLEVDAAVGE